MNPAQLAREDPAGLVRLFKQAERSAHRRPGDLLPIACQLLHLATRGPVVSRGCTRLVFEFEGDRTRAVVNLIAVADARGEFILALDQLEKWKPDSEHRLGDLLVKAAEAFLDEQLPTWRESEGADGHLSVAISQSPDGALVLIPRGHATLRTTIETPMQFPQD